MGVWISCICSSQPGVTELSPYHLHLSFGLLFCNDTIEDLYVDLPPAMLLSLFDSPRLLYLPQSAKHEVKCLIMLAAC